MLKLEAKSVVRVNVIKAAVSKAPALCQASYEAPDIYDLIQFSKQPYRCVPLLFSFTDGKTMAEMGYVICLWLGGGRASSESDP